MVCGVCEQGEQWKAPVLGAIQGHPRRSVSSMPGQRGVQTRGAQGRALLTPLVFFWAADLDRKLDVSPAEPGSKAVERAAVEAHSGTQTWTHPDQQVLPHSFFVSTFTPTSVCWVLTLFPSRASGWFRNTVHNLKPVLCYSNSKNKSLKIGLPSQTITNRDDVVCSRANAMLLWDKVGLKLDWALPCSEVPSRKVKNVKRMKAARMKSKM